MGDNESCSVIDILSEVVEATDEILAVDLDHEISPQEVQEVFGGEQEVINFTAGVIANVVNKVKILKPFTKVMGLAHDWSLMKHKVTVYEKQMKKLSSQVDELRSLGEFNEKYFYSEEFISSLKYLRDGIERSYSEESIANLRRAYVNLLNSKFEYLELKSKYAEVASVLTPLHICVLDAIVEIYSKVDNKDKMRKCVTATGAFKQLIKNGKTIVYRDAAFIMRELEKEALIVCIKTSEEEFFKSHPEINKEEFNKIELTDCLIGARPTTFGIQLLNLVKNEPNAGYV